MLKEIAKYKYGTFMPYLGLYAMNAGFKSTITTHNINVFDPTWFKLSTKEINSKLERRSKEKDVPHEYQKESVAYSKYLAAGGGLKFDYIRPELLIKNLDQKKPIILDVCSTMLHIKHRKNRVADEYSDVSGMPMYHAIVVSGFVKGQSAKDDKFIIVDPSSKRGGIKEVSSDFLIMTAHEASNNMLVIEK